MRVTTTLFVYTMHTQHFPKDIRNYEQTIIMHRITVSACDGA
jgi:hypothetical protein